jgi:hypothetical protein
MRIILAAILATLMGCAATVPKTEYDRLTSSYTTNMEMCGHKISELKQELDEWKPAEHEIKENEEATKSLTLLLEDFTKEFVQFMADTSGEKVEIKADDIGFIDNYDGALVRIWLRFPNMLAKYYMIFSRDGNEEWKYQGYFKAGVVPLIGER